MKDNQHEQLFTELTAKFEAPAFQELDDEVAANCSGGRFYTGGDNPDVLLFESENYKGRVLKINATNGDGDDNLDNSIFDHGWNNIVSSVRVIRGTWQIYDLSGYKGTSKTLTPGDYRYPKDFGLGNDELTGIRRIG